MLKCPRTPAAPNSLTQVPFPCTMRLQTDTWNSWNLSSCCSKQQTWMHKTHGLMGVQRWCWQLNWAANISAVHPSGHDRGNAVGCLIEAGAGTDVATHDCSGTVFYLVAQPDRTEVLRVLIEAGVDRDWGRAWQFLTWTDPWVAVEELPCTSQLNLATSKCCADQAVKLKVCSRPGQTRMKLPANYYKLLVVY